MLKRDSIRFSLGVKQALDELYRTIDSDGNGQINEGEYGVINRKLYLCLRKYWDAELPKLTEAIQRKRREDPDDKYPKFTVRELRSIGVSHWMRGACVKVTESDGRGGSRKTG